MHVQLVDACNLVDAKLVGFNREIGAEEECHADASDNVANNEHNPAEPKLCKGLCANDEHPHVHHVAVYDCGEEGQKISPIKAPTDEASDDDNEALHQIFCHANGKTVP